MSDPVTNVEIEDVLSSIRRLVADDARAAPSVVPDSKDRLVLTPALRVKPENEPAEPVLLTDPIEPTESQRVDDLPIEDIPGDARLADFGEVEGAFPDIDDLHAEHATPEDEIASDLNEDHGDVRDQARLELGRLIEEEVAAALNGAASFEDEDEDVQSDTEGYADDADHSGDATPEHETWAPDEGSHHASHQDDTGHAADDLPGEPAYQAPLTLEDKVAALGRLVARDNHEFEDERDTRDADELTATAEPMVWSEDHKTADAVDEAAVDAAEHDAVDEAEMQEWVEASPEDSNVVHSEGAWPMPAAPDAEATEPFDTPQSVDDVEEDDSALPNSTGTDNVASLPALQLDEDMLRDVVSEIVRQELQGALGERITRNVRKLVRREIHRMLISQEFE